jgi:predicted oxidoreductase
VSYDADVIVVGAGLAGLVAAAEAADAGRHVLLLDQEPENSLGGQAFWSLGGLFLVDSPEQRRLRVRDSLDLALQDWMATATFDRDEDHWPRLWAEAYVHFAAGEKRAWLHRQGVRWFPLVQWAERGGDLATGHGNSVPRFHVTWGSGPGVIEPFVHRVHEAVAAGAITMRFRHRVRELTTTGGDVDGVSGDVLAPSTKARGRPTSRDVVGQFAFRGQAVIVSAGGIGANHDLVRRNWPERMGAPPAHMLSGVPDYVDGEMLQATQRAGGRLIGADRMWNYPEGLTNYDPIWSRHGIRLLPGPSSLWLDARGQRLPAPLFPGFDTQAALSHITRGGNGHSWFLLTQRIMEREFALSGSEQNPDLTSKSVRAVLSRALPRATGPVEQFAKRCDDFVFGRDIPELAAGMNALAGADLIDAGDLAHMVRARDRQVDARLGKDAQVQAIRAARRFLTDRVMRTAAPHRLLDRSAGPLVAIRLSILTRKTLGGLETDLQGRVLRASGEPLSGVYAAGEVAGFGGGGMHGHRSLEGTFLGGCLFSGRIAGRAAAAAVA